jgi:hypothetical protein
MGRPALENWWGLGEGSMIRRFLLAVSAIWIGVCLASLIIFLIVTVQIYECQADDSLWSHWLWYHMLDMRWRGAAMTAMCALPGVAVLRYSINAASSRDRKG